MTTAFVPSVRLPVLADLFARGVARNAVTVVAAAAVTGVAAQIAVPIPGTPVPLTGQTFAVLLVGAALGARRAAMSMALYLLVGMAGLPWFAGHEAGWNIPAFGYIVGFTLAAPVVGALAARGGDRTVWRAGLTMAAGTLLIYAIGVPYLMLTTDVGLGRGVAEGVVPFLIGDAVKLVAAAAVLPCAWWLVGDPGRGSRSWTRRPEASASVSAEDRGATDE